LDKEIIMTGKSILPRHYSAQEMKAQYARVAWFYDAWSRLTEDKALRRLLTLAEVEDGMQILEVAVGTGRLFEKVLRLNPSGNNEGMDLSPVMLAHARRRLEHNAKVGAFRLQEGSAYDLPYESGRFDRLFNTFMVDMFPLEDYPRVLGEFMRVLKPGGRLAIAYFSYGHNWFNQIWPWLAKHFPALLTGCRPVMLGPALTQLGVQILAQESICQNTFPSTIVVAQKPR
jgi:ubiquinone/menaquinone biosynthesis C-methylase UbiE